MEEGLRYKEGENETIDHHWLQRYWDYCGLLLASQARRNYIHGLFHEMICLLRVLLLVVLRGMLLVERTMEVAGFLDHSQHPHLPNGYFSFLHALVLPRQVLSSEDDLSRLFPRR